MPTSIRCPHCSVRIDVKNPALLGKNVRCPKCKQAFVAAEEQASPGFASLDFEEPAPQATDPWSEPAAAPTTMWSAPVREVPVVDKKPELSREEADRVKSRRDFTLMVAGGAACAALAVAVIVFGAISVWRSMQKNAEVAAANAANANSSDSGSATEGSSNSAKLPTIFGFTEARRALLVDYLVSQGQGRPKAKLRMAMIVNSLKKLAEELDIKPTEEFPEGLQLIRERVVMRDIPDELLNGDKIPSDFRKLIDGYKEGSLDPAEEEVAILILVAFLAAEM